MFFCWECDKDVMLERAPFACSGRTSSMKFVRCVKVKSITLSRGNYPILFILQDIKAFIQGCEFVEKSFIYQQTVNRMRHD